jgi:hypothetical protein
VNANRLAVSLALVAMLVSGPPAAIASSSNGPALPSFITYNNNGVVLVYFVSSVRTGSIPACATGSGDYFKLAFDSTTPGGKSMLAGLIAAHSAGEGVWPYGTGDCSVDSATETLLNFVTRT